MTVIAWWHTSVSTQLKSYLSHYGIRAICGTWSTPGDVTASRVYSPSSTSLSFFLWINPHSSVHILSFIFRFPRFGRTMKTSPLFFGGGLEFGDSFMKHLRFKKAKEASPAAIRPHQNTDTVFPKRLLSPRALHWLSHLGSNTLAPLSPKSTLHSPEEQ